MDLIYTSVYVPEDYEVMQRRCDAVERHGGRVCFVQLTCEQAVLEQRVEMADRAAYGKVLSWDELRQAMEREDMLATIPGRESLCIDNTTLSPADAARRIADHFDLPVSTT